MTTLRFIEPNPITLRFVENGKDVQIIEATPKEQILKVGSPTVVNIFNDGGQDAHYDHRQDSALAVWDITHNLDKRPTVDVIDTAGNSWEVIPNFLSNNRLTLTFPAPITGRAYLN